MLNRALFEHSALPNTRKTKMASARTRIGAEYLGMNIPLHPERTTKADRLATS